jgi:UDP-glucose 4-epimerase
MSRYLVTGGAGFVGSHLVDLLLQQNYQVVVIDNLSTGNKNNLPNNHNLEFIEGNMLDEVLLDQSFKNIHGVFHLAAIASVQKSIDKWYDCHKANLTATVKVFNKAAENNIPVVYASSAAVYGANNNLPLKENEIVAPLSPYAIDKYTCELQAQVFGKLKSLKSFGLRLFNVYGLRQLKNSDYSGVISIFKQLAEEKKELTIFGNGKQSRDFIHVSDVAKAFLLAMPASTELAPVVNVCTGKAHTINELAQIISEIVPVKGIKYLLPQSGSVKESLGSTDLLKKLLNFQAKRTLRESLSEIIKH